MSSVTYTPSETDVAEANKLWLRSELRRQLNWPFLLGGAVLCALAGSFYVSDGGLVAIYVAAATGVAVWLSVLCVIVGSIRIWLPRAARKQFSRARSLFREVQVSWSADSITMETANGYSRHTWDEFANWAENKSVLGMFYTDRVFAFIPKRALSSAQADELRSILRRKIGVTS